MRFCLPCASLVFQAVVLWTAASTTASCATIESQLIRTYQAPVQPGPGFTNGFGLGAFGIGDRVVVSAPFADPQGIGNAGAVYVFDAGSGALEHTILSPLPHRWNDFGRKIALAGNQVLVGNPLDWSEGNQGWNQAGRAFLLDPVAGAVVQTIRNPVAGPFLEFGKSVASTSGVSIVTSHSDGGTIFLFEGDAPPRRINDPLQQNLFNGFATYVSAQDGLLLVSGAHSGGNVNRSYIFDVESGELIRTIFSPDPANAVGFGTAQYIAGGNLAITATTYRPDNVDYAGVVYLFDGITQNLIATLRNPDPTPYAIFGFSMTELNGNLIVGGQASQAVYIFSSQTGQLLHTINNPDPSDFGFGQALGTVGGDLLIGADEIVYRYRIVPEPGTFTLALLAIIAFVFLRPVTAIKILRRQ